MEQNPFPEKRKKREERETSTGTRAGTKRNQHIMMEQNPFDGKERREKQGDKHRNPSRNQEEQQIMMEQRPFLARIENPNSKNPCFQVTVGIGIMVNSVASAAFALHMSAGLAERQQNHLSRKKKRQDERQEGRQAPEPEGTGKS